VGDRMWGGGKVMILCIAKSLPSVLLPSLTYGTSKAQVPVACTIAKLLC
jgi:hypothetical protein